MNKERQKLDRQIRRKNRVRAKVTGTAERPRLCLHRSLKYIEAQLIDDTTGKTLVGMSNSKLKGKGTKTEQSAAFGKLFSEAALKAGIKNIVFDRNGRLYHGRVKAFADAVREGGLQF